jgi:hypothetical protein
MVVLIISDGCHTSILVLVFLKLQRKNHRTRDSEHEARDD